MGDENSIKEYINEHRKELENNPNVKSVGKIISYSPEFKVKTVKMKHDGFSTKEIFESNGLMYVQPMSRKYIRKWEKQYELNGEHSFYQKWTISCKRRRIHGV